jgi:hypothetical protein
VIRARPQVDGWKEGVSLNNYIDNSWLAADQTARDPLLASPVDFFPGALLMD